MYLAVLAEEALPWVHPEDLALDLEASNYEAFLENHDISKLKAKPEESFAVFWFRPLDTVTVAEVRRRWRASCREYGIDPPADKEPETMAEQAEFADYVGLLWEWAFRLSVERIEGLKYLDGRGQVHSMEATTMEKSGGQEIVSAATMRAIHPSVVIACGSHIWQMSTLSESEKKVLSAPAESSSSAHSTAPAADSSSSCGSSSHAMSLNPDGGTSAQSS